MKFGTIFELQPGPPPFGKERIAQVWHEALEQAVLTEELGFDYVWAVEHHFLGGYSSSSAPEVFLATLAGRTERVRLAQGVALVLKDVNHAWRLAERAAALDIVSDGRFDFGAGRSITKQELIGFGMNPEDSRPMQLEVLDMLPRMWTEKTFSWNGRYYDLPERELAVRPVQEPHPPMWLACSQPESWRLAGERGLGVLSFGIGRHDVFEQALSAYEEGLSRANPPSGMINRRIACAPLFYCAETDEEALRTARPHVEFFLSNTLAFVNQWASTQSADYSFYRDLLAGSNGPLPHMPLVEPVDLPGLSEEEARLGGLAQAGSVCIGSPETCAAFLQKYVDAGFDQIILSAQYGTLTNEQIQRSLRLFAQEVLPRFSETAAAMVGSAD
jgi:alkanesulfonate monooxygenase SsuD/methylene tetrahydromethanopterin reductase-like flavin-dependent oxidoreductase (luciferase family)